MLKIKIDTEIFRWSLFNDGYLYNDLKVMSEEKLQEILECRVNQYLTKEFRGAKLLMKNMGYPIPIIGEPVKETNINREQVTKHLEELIKNYSLRRDNPDETEEHMAEAIAYELEIFVDELKAGGN